MASILAEKESLAILKSAALLDFIIEICTLAFGLSSVE